MPLAPVRAPLLAPFRRAFLVALLALAALAAICGSAGAQPGPDDDPNYNDPMWRYANPAEQAVTAALPAEDQAAADGSASAVLIDEPCGNEIPEIPLPKGGCPVPVDEVLSAGGR